MRLHRLICISLAALSASILVLSSRCVAADIEEEASASTPSPASLASPLRSLALTGQGNSRFDRYINRLDHTRIRRLTPSYTRNFDLTADPRTPFFGRVPLYSIRTPPPIVEQALRDHGSVGLVDSLRRQAMQIFLGGDHLSQHPFPDMATVLGVYELDPRIHRAKKAFLGQLHVASVPENVDALPHAFGLPVLLPGSDSVGHILGATRQDARAFWYPTDPRRFVHVDLRTDPLYAKPGRQTLADVLRTVDKYRADTDTYGRATAGVLNGRALHHRPGMQHAHVGKIKLRETPRFAAVQASREQLVDALQMFGRYHVYVQEPTQVRTYKVKLMRDGRQGVFKTKVQPLSRFKRWQEEMLEKAGVIHLPV
ncbi:hypothetical protein PSEUBRA_002369 [Kalmanozyma brasiliensis GHG001]|uniref:uncharacterized protein n=1 Tax=Kalmanozyma brasiliensis (strain GHG001) TaxID=1365824 RepID=UPI001CEA6F69|nr:uncharacterized protein PSEUBRA_002369 [Kalmanozyma brasiliensis GHG001]KAF6767074.1 hypothetical protein PSEUBRA_002369 [Kalmanozyma brasiliensis GHG001]